MSLALVTGAAHADSIAVGIVLRLPTDEWEVVTSHLATADWPCDLSDATEPGALIERSAEEREMISALVLGHAHDVESGVLDTTAESFDQQVAVNARASLLLIAAFARQAGPPGGAILNTAARELGPRGSPPTSSTQGRSTAGSADSGFSARF